MPGKRTSKRSAASKAQEKIKRAEEDAEDQDLEQEEEEEEDAPAPAKRGRKAKGKGKAKAKKIKEEGEEDNDDAEEEEGAKMKSVVLKGKVPVDEHCPVKDKCHVLDEGGEDVWDCMLNQTNIQNNNNKFYLIQVIKEDTKKTFYVWMRWGRVGYKGQTSLTPCGSDAERAKNVFSKKFSDKTRNEWEERASFEKVGGKYDWVKMDYSADDAEEAAKKEEEEEEETGKGEKSKKSKKKNKAEKNGESSSSSSEVKKEPEESKLHPAVQELIRLICDVDAMEQTMVEMQYDTRKAPLGKITNQQIKAGYEALKRITEVIASSNKSGRSAGGGDLMQACNDFYTRIPHEFGMRVPPLIRTMKEVKKKIELLEALGDIQVAMKLLKDVDGSSEDESLHPVDRQYRRLGCGLRRMGDGEEEAELLKRYISTTHGRTHTMYDMEVKEIFEVERPEEEERFKKDLGNRVLLFHGSRLSNWAGILGQGLRIAPPEAPPTGYMFGKGVYFADMASKSANYCWATPSRPAGLLALCEVALGTQREMVSADCNAPDRLSSSQHSVKGLGQTAPDPAHATALKDGTLVPMGPAAPTGLRQGDGGAFTLAYNEFIVYDVAQVRMRYLARIDFKFSR